MDIKRLRDTLAPFLLLASLVLAIAATAKLFGLVTMRPGVMEMCAASIAFALLSR